MEGCPQRSTQTTGLHDQFRVWIDPRCPLQPPIVLVGAGLSAGLVPLALNLALGVGARKKEIERQLGVTSQLQVASATDLYAWAGECLAQLVSSGMTDAAAKRMLADSIGVTTDPSFLARANVPLRGTTPRHRVLGRLAREGRVSAIWSFNWDCWLEASLETVGLMRGETPENRSVAPEAWKLKYHVWVNSESNAENAATLSVFKAHGCVRSLAEGRGDFVITAQEMGARFEEQQHERKARMGSQIAGRSAITLGWSASEKYVREFFELQHRANNLGSRITIVDSAPRNPEHLNVCASFNCGIDEAAAQVAREGPGTTDDLLLWIQTLRGLASLKEACTGNAQMLRTIEEVSSGIPAFSSDTFSSNWCVSLLDCWLPIWLRTCFLSKAQRYGTVPGEEAEIVPSEHRDVHIPWGGNLQDRADLQAAASLLTSLHRAAPEHSWDYDTFPGALWNRPKQLIVIAVPIWLSTEDISAIYLKPLVESSHWAHKARIRRILLLPLHSPSAPAAQDYRAERLERWKESISSLFGNAHLASPNTILVTDLDEIANSNLPGVE